ncbi:MAG: CPBP family intramembrane glutamic endopeptidase [Armatimonadota bacterium]
MGFEGITPEQRRELEAQLAGPPLEESPPPATSRSPEPFPVLILGIVFFLAFLTLIWLSHARQSGAGASPSSFGARLNTYFVEGLLYWQASGDIAPTLAPALQVNRMARQTAEAWQETSDALFQQAKSPEETTDARKQDAYFSALQQVNAAALYWVAEDERATRTALATAIKRDPRNTMVLKEIAALYQPDARPVRLSAKTESTVKTLTAGPLIRARNAQLDEDHAAELAALRPGVEAAKRVMIAVVVPLSVMGFLVFAAWITYLIMMPRLRRLIEPAAHEPAPTVPWGPGTALLLISAVFLLTYTLVYLLQPFVTAYGVTARLAVNVVAELLSICIILAGFLVSRGYKPWAWGIFGWRAPRWSIGYGLLILFMSLPAVWAASIISGILLRDRDSMHPLIQLLFNPHDIWLVVISLFAASVMAPLVEETLFRGLLFRALDARIPFWRAAILSGFVFSLVHGELTVVLPITILGIVFAYLTRHSRGIWASVTAHAAFNGFNTAMALMLSWALQVPGT